MICQKCGAENASDNKFCSNCGSRIFKSINQLRSSGELSEYDGKTEFHSHKPHAGGVKQAGAMHSIEEDARQINNNDSDEYLVKKRNPIFKGFIVLGSIILVAVMLVASFGFLFIDDGFTNFGEKSVKVGDYELGNIQGNLINSSVTSSVASYNGWTYLTGDDGKLYKMLSDGSNMQLLYAGEFTRLSVLGKWIYFTTREEGTTGKDERSRIWKMSIDGGAPVCIVEDASSGDVIVQGGKVFYTKITGDSMADLRVFDVKTNEDSLLATGFISHKIAAREGWIYYFTYTGNSSIENNKAYLLLEPRRIRVDGYLEEQAGKTDIMSDNINGVLTDGAYLWITSNDNDLSDYSDIQMQLKTGEKVLGNETGERFGETIVINDDVYALMVNDDNEQRLIKYDKDVRKIERVFELKNLPGVEYSMIRGLKTSMFYADNFMYFYLNNGKVVYRLNLETFESERLNFE